jgi:hypothetical protein
MYYSKLRYTIFCLIVSMHKIISKSTNLANWVSRVKFSREYYDG